MTLWVPGLPSWYDSSVLCGRSPSCLRPRTVEPGTFEKGVRVLGVLLEPASQRRGKCETLTLTPSLGTRKPYVGTPGPTLRRLSDRERTFCPPLTRTQWGKARKTSLQSPFEFRSPKVSGREFVVARGSVPTPVPQSLGWSEPASAPQFGVPPRGAVRFLTWSICRPRSEFDGGTEASLS